MVEFVIMPPIVLGLVIGVYEIILLHRDVVVLTHRFGHGIHALVYAIIACFATMNADWVISNFTFLKNIPMMSVITLQILVGIITMIKIHGVSAAIRGTGVGGMAVGMRETWFHSALVAALVVAAPYVWPLIAPILPAWMQ